MDAGALITWIVLGLFLLFLLIFPIWIKAFGKARPDDPQTAEREDSEREAAYRRGLLIGGLMGQARATQQTNPQHVLEQVIIDQMIIEQLQQHRNNEMADKESHHQ